MTLATVITILGIINGLMAAAKEAPGVIDEAKSLLAKVEPYVADMPFNVQYQFKAIKSQLS